MGEEQRVCVTGAGGYLASWVVKSLLSEGYVVHGTVIPVTFLNLSWKEYLLVTFQNSASFEFVLFSGDNKNAHLMKLEKASENLKLFKTDLLDYESLCTAIDGCVGVFHIASPVPLRGSVIDLQVELMQPAITGTKNVLNACLKAKVKKVVVVSSTGAVVLNPNRPKDQSMDEESWSDLESCKAIQNWYCVAKTIAERETLEYVKRGELNIVTVCPSIIIGPLLQSPMNSSSLYFLKFLRDGCESADNGVQAFVDVRDTAAAVLLVYDKAEVEGRYIISSHEIGTQDLVKSFYPNYNYPKSFNEVETKMNVSSAKLQNLGWKYRPLEETLIDAVNNYEETGALFITSSMEPGKS